MVATISCFTGTSPREVIPDDLLELLRCPQCDAGLALIQAPTEAKALCCERCSRCYPIMDAVPRFVDVPAEEIARRTQASFGYEWTHFRDWRQSGSINFNDYFQGFDLDSLQSAIVLDAGCGMGRHARQVAPFARRLIALDFSRAIDQAKRNTDAVANVSCVQADLLALPFADQAFDVVYSLGVLHHLERTEEALRMLVRKLKVGGRLRVYLYWKRHGWTGGLLNLVTALRCITTRLPFPALRACCGVLSVALFGGVVLPYRVVSAAGVRGIESWPLYVYTKYPFNVLYNDQFDRFSAPIEKRYDANEVVHLLENAGLSSVTVRPCFGWIADGIRPDRAAS